MSTSDETSGMDTGELDPAIASILEPHRPTRRRWAGTVARRRRLIIAAAIAVALLSTTGAIVANYQPLVEGRKWWGGTPTSCLDGPHHVTAPRSGESFGRLEISCGPGTVISWSESLINDGPFSIRINDIPAPATSELENSEIRLGEGPGSGTRFGTGAAPGDWEMLAPFSPFVLAPGEQQVVVYRARIADDCSAQSATLFQFSMRYSLFGISRSDWVPHNIVASITCD